MISPEVVKLFGWEGGWLVSIMSCCLSVGSDVALFVMYLSNAPQQPILSIHQCCVWDLPNTVSLSRRFFDVLVPPSFRRILNQSLQCFRFQSLTSERTDEPPEIHWTNYNDKDEMIMGIVMTVWQVYWCFSMKHFSDSFILIITF